MKKTKLLTSLVALALVVGLGACETGDITVNVGDVDIGDSSDATDTEPSEPSEPSSSDTGSTPSEPEEDSSSSSSTSEEPPVVTHEYSIEVENADALKELTYDGNAATQQGVQLSIYLVDTPSEGDPTKEAATENDVTFTVSNPTVVTVSGLTVLPLKEGSTSITIAWADKATTSVDVLVTDITVTEPEGPTSWADVITGAGDYDKATALLGATLDEILPFYFVETGFQQYYVTDTRVDLYYGSEPSGLVDAWISILLEDGWTQGETDTSLGTTYSFTKDGYTVELYSAFGSFDIYVYPKAETGDEGEEGGEDLETAQAILDAAAAQTSYGGFGCVHLVNQVSQGDAAGNSITYTFDITTDENNNLYGKYSWLDSTDAGPRMQYFYNKYYYANSATTGKDNPTANPTTLTSSQNSVDGIISARRGTLTGAFTNASSIDLSSATDLELVTEDNGNYKLTFAYNGTGYCYKATSSVELVGAGYFNNWTDLKSYEYVYGEATTREAIEEIMEPFYATEVWFPKQASDEEIAQEILNAAAAQTSYYGGFGNLHIDGQIPESGVANYTTTISGDLTVDDNNNVFGKFQWANSDDPGPKIRYYYEKYYYYDNMANNGSHSYQTSPSSIGTGSSKNTINGVLDERFPNIGFSSTYTCAFTNASSIDLASATDLELTTEDNGNYKLTLIYNDIWYCYKADTDLNLVGAGYSTNWTSLTNFEIVYGEETTRAAIDEIMERDFFSVEVWFPKEEEEASEDEIAASILESAEDTTITWSAFHGEYIDESTDETDTLYLTTDSDGLYGSGICLDDGDASFEYYYKNGKEYVHNNNWGGSYSINDSDFYYGDTYDDILSDFTSDALDNADWADLDDDDWTLSTLTDGYELVVDTYLIVGWSTTQAQLVYITDTNFNITGLGYATFDSTFGYIEGWYAEQATTAQVEASLAGFDPANWGEVEEETEPSANEQVLAALEAFTNRGANYAWGEGFSYTSMSMDSYSYVVNEIAATSDDKGYLTSSTIDFSIGYSDSYGYYSDGSTTYGYDGEDVTDYESLLFDYSAFYSTAYMTFAWQDYEYILEALEEFAYLDDLIVDDDFVVSDTAIYIYAYTSDYESYFELDATYDENGLTSLSFSSYINGEALAISLEPTSTISAPSWYL